MPKIEITVPEHLEMQIAQLVEQGEFINREEAVEELLSTGLKAYKTSGPMEDEDEPFEDEGMMGHEDEYVF
jgi:Arc/MetJ-type ribon-helix-helix transcriptional regulator